MKSKLMDSVVLGTSYGERVGSYPLNAILFDLQNIMGDSDMNKRLSISLITLGLGIFAAVISGCAADRVDLV
ncbi:MAG: hypothetical protein ACYTGS_18855, partial [Planctomycetota bacterium]